MKQVGTAAKTFLIAMAIISFLFSCGPNKPTIDKNKIDTLSVMDDSAHDTTKLLVSELPIKFDSTDVLLSAIHLVDLQERGGYSISSEYFKNSAGGSGAINDDHISGNFINIVFWDKTESERKLTDKKIRIRSINFLRNIFKSTKAAYLLYSISDRDSNGDKEIDYSDLESLYISKVDGTGFKKLTKELHELYDWTSLKKDNKIYFRTLEDMDKNEILNNNDKFHYYVIEFAGDGYSLIEYNPLKIFE